MTAPRDSRSTDKARLHIILRPRQAMNRTMARNIIFIVACMFMLAMVRFSIAGAWPVAIFLALDVLGLWLAFALYRKKAQQRDIIELTRHDLRLTHISPGGATQTTRMEPYWARVELSSPAMQLRIISRDINIEIGRFLTEREKKRISSTIADALSQWRSQPAAT